VTESLKLNPRRVVFKVVRAMKVGKGAQPTDHAQVAITVLESGEWTVEVLNREPREVLPMPGPAAVKEEVDKVVAAKVAAAASAQAEADYYVGVRERFMEIHDRELAMQALANVKPPPMQGGSGPYR